MKRRSRGAEGLDTADLQLASKKRVVTYSTFQKLQKDFDKNYFLASGSSEQIRFEQVM